MRSNHTRAGGGAGRMLSVPAPRPRRQAAGLTHPSPPAPPPASRCWDPSQNFDQAQELFEELLARDPHRIEVGARRGQKEGGRG